MGFYEVFVMFVLCSCFFCFFVYDVRGWVPKTELGRPADKEDSDAGGGSGRPGTPCLSKERPREEGDLPPSQRHRLRSKPPPSGGVWILQSPPREVPAEEEPEGYHVIERH